MVEAKIGANANLHQSTVKMTNKKLCYFKWSSKSVMKLDLQDEIWSEETVDKSDFEFKKAIMAVTLPNGDCLITGGDESTTVY